FAAMLVNIWLAAGLAFATTPLYAAYAGRDAAAALSDQQLAGVVMWLPADLVYFVTLLALLRRILTDLEARLPRRIAPEELGRGHPPGSRSAPGAPGLGRRRLRASHPPHAAAQTGGPDAAGSGHDGVLGGRPGGHRRLPPDADRGGPRRSGGGGQTPGRPGP